MSIRRNPLPSGSAQFLQVHVGGQSQEETLPQSGKTKEANKETLKGIEGMLYILDFFGVMQNQ